MTDNNIDNNSTTYNTGVYWGLGVQAEAMGTNSASAATIDADGDGQVDDPTNDSRGFGAGFSFILGDLWQKDNAKWGFDASAALSGNYLFDPDGMQYYVPSVSSQFGSTSEADTKCGSTNCTDIEFSRFPSIDLTLRPLASYSIDANNRFLFGPTVDLSFMIEAYAPARVKLDDQMENSSGSVPYYGALRGGAHLALAHDFDDGWSLVPFAAGSYGGVLVGPRDDSPRGVGNWHTMMGLEIHRNAESDRDGDGLSDKDENNIYGTDPRNPDTDGDGLGDGLEVRTNTNPLKKDTDGDHIDDGVEDANRDGAKGERETDPRLLDTDADGLNDDVEIRRTKTNPLNPDTDDDTLIDGDENPEARDARYGGSYRDTDADDRINALDPDDDGDGILTRTEVADARTVNDDVNRDGKKNWLDVNSDGDDILDHDEPTDTDNNGIKNYLEVNARAVAIAPAPERIAVTSAPIIDTDGDGLPDSLELEIGSNPRDPDSDHDGITDKIEYDDAMNLKSSNLMTQHPEIKFWNDIDGDANMNWIDSDADNDGLIDGGVAEGREGEGRIDRDADGVLAYMDRSDILIRKEGQQLKFDGTINFEKNKAILLDESFAILYSLFDYINIHPEIKKVTIEGFTSSEGTRAYNQTLSEKRANAVYQFLLSKGIRAGVVLESHGYGEDQLLIAPDNTEEKRRVNRRTEFHIEETTAPIEINATQNE